MEKRGKDLEDLAGRGGEIRTPDILLPKQARYRTALYPDWNLAPRPGLEPGTQ